MEDDIRNMAESRPEKCFGSVTALLFYIVSRRAALALVGLIASD